MATNATAPKVCGASNGTYSCQFEHTPGSRHAGMHYAYSVSAGRAYVSEWVDKYSQVTERKAPAPTARQR